MKVLFCLPGKSFSNNFLQSWSELLLWCFNNGITPYLNVKYNAVVYYCRNQLLGADLQNGPEQKPFNGKLDYDYIMWIDSDMVFNPDQLIDLIESTDVHNVVAGHYLMADCKSSAVVKDWNTEYFSKNGSFEFMTPKDIETWKNATGSKFIPVSYVGLGFFAIKKEVLDKLKYPYYNSELQQIKTEDGSLLVDICGEDVALCKNIQSAGYQVFVNADIRIGHEKSLIL